MELIFFEEAEEDIKAMDNSIRLLFINRLEKLEKIPPRRHMKFGMPFNVEEVGQGRIIFQIRGDTLYIIRCFSTHKEYEKWYMAYK